MSYKSTATAKTAKSNLQKYNILIHYGEIALKRGNRMRFERQLIRNIRKQCQPLDVQRQYGRILLAFKQIDESLLARLAMIPGIYSISPMSVCETQAEIIAALASEIMLDYLQSSRKELPNKNNNNFAVRVKRANKNFPMTSPELAAYVGSAIYIACEQVNTPLKVNLSNPDICLHIEVDAHQAYLYVRKIKGVGGLPVSSSGKGIVLFSGGIDSPVAAFSMMKRGLEIELVHFYNSSFNADRSKIEQLAQVLARYQPKIRLHYIDLAIFQRHAIAFIPAKYRMIIYKRHMLRVAEKVAERCHAGALITGDSLGQVASQTLANIQAIYSVISLPMFSPLIAMDKEDIIQIARKLETFEPSIEEYCDLCAFMVDKHPETQAKQADILLLENEMPIDELMQDEQLPHEMLWLDANLKENHE
ncbi:MAG: tRNA uracil 4-sulfurtransferase ThiI [Mariprofundales bacterium]